jgi:hypothetical protein
VTVAVTTGVFEGSVVGAGELDGVAVSVMLGVIVSVGLIVKVGVIVGVSTTTI